MLVSHFYKTILISIYSLGNKTVKNSRYFGRFLWVPGSVSPLIDTLKIIAEYYKFKMAICTHSQLKSTIYSSKYDFHSKNTEVK